MHTEALLLRRLLALALATLALPALAGRPAIIDNANVAPAAEWQEAATPSSAPEFSAQRLLALDLPRHVSLQAGIDPQSISVGADQVVRYVVVMRNRSGSQMAAFEGIRCETREVKTFGRQNSSGEWVMLAAPKWVPLNAEMPSHHALAFARQAACTEGNVPTREGVVAALRSGAPTLEEQLNRLKAQ